MSIKSELYRRLLREDRWYEAEVVRDKLMASARAQGLGKQAAQQAVYAQLETLFPPLLDVGQRANDDAPAATAAEPPDEANEGSERAIPAYQATNERTRLESRAGQVVGDAVNPTTNDDVTSAADQTRATTGDSSVIGLGEIPQSWPKLPPNASLASEIQWVLANRLQCIQEQRDRTVVDLSKALTPAPSYAALGWLETSIRAFAKFVDVSSKVSASGQDEADRTRRERLSIEEIRSLLSEMAVDTHAG